MLSDWGGESDSRDVRVWVKRSYGTFSMTWRMPSYVTTYLRAARWVREFRHDDEPDCWEILKHVLPKRAGVIDKAMDAYMTQKLLGG